MKKFLFGLVATSALVFGTGCGSSDEDLCEDFYSGLEKAAKKGDACGGESEPTPDSDKKAAIDQCKKAISSCNDNDKEIIEGSIECLGKVKACTPGNENQYGAQMFACFFQIAAVSEKCSNAFGTGDEVP